MNDLAEPAKKYILGTIFVGTTLLAWNLLHLQLRDPWMLLVLTIVASASHVLKVEGPTPRSNYQVSFIVYGFALIVLGPAQAALIITVAHVAEWIRYRYPWYIQSFNLGSFVITLNLSSLVSANFSSDPHQFGPVTLAGMLLTMAVFTLLNHVMMGLVLLLARGETFKQSEVFGTLNLMIDYTLFGLGIAGALSWEYNPYMVTFIIIPIYLIYMTLKIPALKRQSNTDAKTGLYNMRYFNEALESELARAKRLGKPLTVVMSDLDLFRNINNAYGHAAGDKILVGIAAIMRKSFRNYDVVARFGGEEFIILMPETTLQSAYGRVEALRRTIEATGFEVPTSLDPVCVTMSFGLASREEGEQSEQDIINDSDMALYQAKANGRNCTVLFSKEGGYQQFEGNENAMEMLEASGRPGLPPGPLVTATERPQKTANLEAEMPKPYPDWMPNLYLAVVFITALLLTRLTLSSLKGLDWFGLAVFGLVVLFTEAMPVEVYVKDTAVSTSATVMIAGFILFGPAGVLGLSLVQSAVILLKYRGQFKRSLFNFGNQTLAGLLCVWAIHLAGNTFFEMNILVQIVITLLAAVIVYLMTTTLLSVAIQLSTGEPAGRVWNERFRWLGYYYLAMGGVAYVFIYSYRLAGLIGVIGVLAPLMLLRFSQKQYLDRTTEMVRKLHTNLDELKSQSNEILQLNDTLLLTMANVIDVRNPYVLGHSQSVSRFAVSLAQELNLPHERVEQIRNAALLHDIGKLGIPDSILWKKGSLDPQEYATIQNHPRVGSEIVGKIVTLKDIVPGVLYHHEHYDGSGYPCGLAGEAIPLEARILALADAVDAMSSDRPYRQKFSFAEIVNEIQKNSGTQFDPKLVEILARMLIEESGVITTKSMFEDVPVSRSVNRDPEISKYNGLTAKNRYRR